MSHAILALNVPLALDAGGTIRVGGSRVSLDVIANDFNHGRSVEEIAEAYSTLALEDVYAAITYYLQHRAALAGYLDDGERKAKAAHAAFAARFPPGSIRARLLVRRNAAGA